ncbi:unnamed protein product [Moneuplotes crassus]|uniref:histidine--tRNA ligase n=1 Tax=Euplotes crassus TaxID=5936 RepID=A0AAD1UED7_EUPCR|nr:unnamed protein product [Moneuplotes crassus]
MILPKVCQRGQRISLRGATLSRKAQWNHAHIVTPHFRPYSGKEMIQTVKGMKDVEGLDYDKFSYVTSTASKIAASFGYSNIMTNILEPEELFKRSLGQYSDIVNKEMYSFEDLGKRRLVLRPEGTAGVIRHLLNDSGKLHSLHKSNLKYFYQGPMYRYERPQAGRQRQFYQMGIENLCMNDSGPIHDLEIILLADTILKEIVPSQKDLVLEINSLGSPGVMSSYNKLLVEYFTLPENWSRLSKQSQMRVENKNPLRVLDSKNPADQEVSLGSPKIQDVYDKESREKFEGVITGLDSLGIKYQINPNLCRGLDYYEHTCFEYKYNSKKLGRSQNTILAGGRYDGLAQYLGHSEPISSVGNV